MQPNRAVEWELEPVLVLSGLRQRGPLYLLGLLAPKSNKPRCPGSLVRLLPPLDPAAA